MDNNNNNNNKSCHLFDLDNTLWEIDRKVWVIDKRYPSEPIFKIEESDFNLIKGGVFKSYGNKVTYSGKKYYIDNEMRERVENLKVPMLNIGFSLIEYRDEDTIKSLDVNINEKLIYSLRNKVDDIYVISDNSIDKYQKQKKVLEKSLNKFGHNVKEYYIVTEDISDNNEDSITWTKGLIILKKLIGLNIKDSKFIDEASDYYNSVNYYESNEWVIKHIEQINKQLNKIYHNSDDNVKSKVMERFSGEDITLNIMEVTNNFMNNIIVKKVEINRPSNIMLFESFKNIKK